MDLHRLNENYSTHREKQISLISSKKEVISTDSISDNLYTDPNVNTSAVSKLQNGKIDRKDF